MSKRKGVWKELKHNMQADIVMQLKFKVDMSSNTLQIPTEELKRIALLDADRIFDALRRGEMPDMIHAGAKVTRIVVRDGPE